MKSSVKKRRTKSISRQISLSLFLTTFFIFLITELLILERSYNALLNAHDARLKMQAENLGSLTDMRINGTLDFDFDTRLKLEYSGSDLTSTSYFLILDFADGNEVCRSTSLDGIHLIIPQTVSEREFDKTYFWTAYLNDKKVRFTAYREKITTDPEEIELSQTKVEIKNVEFIFIVGKDFQNINKQFMGILKLTSGSLSVGLIILLAFERIILRKNLRMLNEFRDEVSEISSANLTPVSVPAVSEIAAVAETLNKVILKLKESFNRERRFTADVAHELRTPISEIRTLAEVTLKFSHEKNEADLRNYADILASTKQMENIVKNLLILTRLDSNAIISEKSPMDLNKVITTSWGRYKDKAVLKNISLNKIISNPFMINSDHEMFVTIADNLISNAIEYSPHGSSIEISASGGLDYFNLSVSNTAANLTRDDLSMIFGRFWRKDEVRTSDSSHCGLGLSVVKSFVEFLGYDIRAILSSENRLIITISGTQKSE